MAYESLTKVLFTFISEESLRQTKGLFRIKQKIPHKIDHGLRPVLALISPKFNLTVTIRVKLCIKENKLHFYFLQNQARWKIAARGFLVKRSF